jgi:hypothetical protein
MAYTGVTMLTGDDLGLFYKYVQNLLKLKRPPYTHEIAFRADDIKNAAREDFMRLCSNASDDVIYRFREGK